MNNGTGRRGAWQTNTPQQPTVAIATGVPPGSITAAMLAAGAAAGNIGFFGPGGGALGVTLHIIDLPAQAVPISNGGTAGSLVITLSPAFSSATTFTATATPTNQIAGWGSGSVPLFFVTKTSGSSITVTVGAVSGTASSAQTCFVDVLCVGV
jgi:hypothetical protein